MKKEDNLKEPWQPGQSGNPKGKPIGARNRATIYREHLEKQGKLGQVVDDVVLAIIDKALTGDVTAAKEVLDSGYGKVADRTQEVPPEREKDMVDDVLGVLTDEQLEILAKKALQNTTNNSNGDK